MRRHDLYVVVPFYNEAAGIHATLEALASQSDADFSLLLVDNGSTDGGAAVAAAVLARHPGLDAQVLWEPQKGTGAAADSGFRAAIQRGAAFIARTDADCLPDRHWVRTIRRALRDEGLDFVAGKIKPRTDDCSFTLLDRLLVPLLVLIAENFGKLHHRGPRFKYPYLMAAGNNLAITAAMYLQAGGFPRTRIEDVHEDHVLSECVRLLTSKAKKKNDVVVYNSIRRLKQYGYVNTLLWYWDHRYRPELVDIR